MLRAEVDRVVGDDLIARGVGGVDRIALEHVVAVVLDRSRSHLGRVGHASPPLGLRGARGLAGAFAFAGAFSAFFVAGVFAFATAVVFAPSRLGFAAFRSVLAPAPVCAVFSVVFGVGGGAFFAASSSARKIPRRVGKECVGTCRSRWAPVH